MPGYPGVTVVTMLVCFFIFACEAAGASSARHSLRPLNFQMALCLAKLARIMRRECGGVCVCELSATSFPTDRDHGSDRHCERKRSNPFHREKKEWIASSRWLLAKTAERHRPTLRNPDVMGIAALHPPDGLLNELLRSRSQMTVKKCWVLKTACSRTANLSVRIARAIPLLW
jgi:hypothetical protein